MQLASSQVQPQMEKPRLRALNRTEGTIITPDVIEIDSGSESFIGAAENLQSIATCGIWHTKELPRRAVCLKWTSST